MEYPRITAHLGALRENIEAVAGLLHGQGRQFAAVAKGVCADGRVTALLDECGCDMFADSRLDNLKAIRTKKPKMLLRIAQQWELPELVDCARYSFQSEPDTIARLGAEARRQGKRHGVVLACDLGDLREGCFFRDRPDIRRAAQAVLREERLELAGVGMNLACFGGVLPCGENLGALADIADFIRAEFHVPLPLVSGCATSSIFLLQQGLVPAGVNHARIGETWLNGFDSGALRPIPGMRQDTFTIEAQLVELKMKPSRPIGPRGGDAFGLIRDWPDRGDMLRGIVAIGRQDTDPEALIPLDGRVEILGASCDHLLLNMSAAPEYRVGDIIPFHMRYAAMFRAYTSPYVAKRYD